MRLLIFYFLILVVHENVCSQALSETEEKSIHALLDTIRELSLKDPERGLKLISGIMKEIPIQGNEKILINALLSEANCFKNLDRKGESLNSSSKAIALSEQIHHRGLSQHSYYQKATVFQQYGDRDSLMVYFQKVIELDRPDMNPYYAANAYVNIGQEYATMGIMTKAEDYLLKGYNVARNDPYAKMFALVPLISFYYHFNNPKYLPYLDTLAMSDFYQKASSASTMNHFDAFLMLNKVSGTKKEKTLREVYAYALLHSSKINQVNFGKKLCNYLIESKRYDEAYSLLLELYQKARESENGDLIENITQKLFETSKSRGDLKNALAYLERLSRLKDSLNTEENSKRITELNIKFESAQKDHEIEQRNFEIAQSKASKNRIIFILISIIVFLGLIAFLLFSFMRQRNLKRKAIEKAETVHKMAELELQSLRAQLNPHFMFNSLNAIQELILLEENDKSHTYLARFAKLLRMLLENANSPFIPLARELEFLQLYLSLENLRIPDLKYDIKVDPSINTEQVKIPNMILQPYIENAIWHGLSPKAGDKKLQIHIGRQNGSTVYEIEDNGIGRQKAAEMKSLYRKEHKSRGMELLTKRFKLLSKEYGSEINTTVADVVRNNDVQGTKVTIEVPVSLYKEQAVA